MQPDKALERFAQVADSGILIAEGGGSEGPVVTFVNPAFARLSGHDVPDLMGRPLAGALVLPPEVAPGQGWRGETTLIRRDGSMGWVAVELRPVGEGAVVALVQDRTPDHRAEERLADSERKLKEAQRIAGVGWWEYDAGTPEAVWSENLYDIWGVDPSTFRPTLAAITAMILPEDRDAFELTRGPEAPSHSTAEFRIRRPDGEIRHLRADINVAFDGQGRPVRWFGVSVDITQEKQAADAIEAARRAAVQANQAKSRFLAAASHDLRQPLNAMSLLLGVLRPKVTEPGARDVVERLKRSLDSMMELFNALLDISKFEAGAVEVRHAVVPVGALLARIEEDYGPTARAKGLDLRVLATHVGVWTDPTLLERILRNLVSNAIRYTERGRVVVGCRRRGGDVRVDVIDTGSGIPADQRRAIFDEFHQAAPPDTRSPEGHGLGLAIVQRAAGLLGHPIDLESVPGRGSRFSITVPKAADLRPVVEPMAASATPSPLVVVIEDDPLVAAALRFALEDLGCEVVSARESGEAEGRLARLGRTPHLLLADFRLRGRPDDGLDAIARLRERCGAEVPAVLMSGDLSADIRERAERDGVDCLAKPIRPGDLERLLGAAQGVWALGRVRPIRRLAANG